MQLNLTKLFLLVTIFWLLSSSVTSKDKPLLIPTVEFVNLTQLSTSDGLSDNTVNHFYQDKTGYLWLSTELGLNRFDSHRVNQLRGNQQSITNKVVNSILQDSGGYYWVATGNGLFIFDSNMSQIQAPRFPSPNGQQKKANRVIGSIEIAAGFSWVVTWNGFYKYNIKNKEITRPQSMNFFQRDDFNILSFHKEKTRVWLGTDQGIYYFDLNNQKLTKIEIDETIDHAKITRIKSFEEHSLLFSNETGLYELNTQALEDIEQENVETIRLSMKKLYAEEVMDFVASPDQSDSDFIFSTLDSVYLYRSKSKKIDYLFNLNAALPNTSNYRIKTLYIDKQSLLWIGTRNRGAYRWDTRALNFSVFTHQAKDPNKKLNGNHVWGIELNGDSELLVSTGKGLNSINIDRLNSTSIIDETNVDEGNNQLTNKQLKIFDVYALGERLWVGSAESLSDYKASDKSIKHYRPKWLDKKEEFKVYSITSIEKSSLWLGTSVGTLNFNIESKKFEYSQSLRPHSIKERTHLVKNINGSLLIGTASELFIHSPTLRTTQSYLKSKKNNKDVNFGLSDAIYFNQQLWVSYIGDGIYILENSEIDRILGSGNLSSSEVSSNETKQTDIKLKLLDENSNKVHHFSRKTDFPDAVIYALEDIGDFVWATSNTGIIRINKKTRQFSLFDSHFGVHTYEFNEASSLYVKNQLILGSPNGLTLFEPDIFSSLNIKPQKPKVTEIKIVEKDGVKTRSFSTDAVPELVLSSQSVLSIKIAMFDFRNSNNWEFEYWVSEQPESTNKITNQTEILLANLSPGRHVLNIKAKSKYHLNESDVTSLKIKITEKFLVDNSVNLSVLIVLGLLFLTLLLILVRNNRRTRRRLTEIRADERRLENALLDENRGIWELNAQADGVTVLTVYQQDEEPIKLTLQRYFEYFYNDSQDKIKEVWLRFSEGYTDTISESYKVYFHGELIWNYVHGKVISYDKMGKPLKCSGIWVNTSEEKKLEEKLNLYSHAFESTQDIVFILDSEFSIIAVNKAYELSTGYKCEQMTGKNMVDIAFTRFTKMETNAIKESIILNKHWKGDSSVPRRDAPSFPVDIRINVITSKQQETGYVVVMSDTSDSERQKKSVLDNRFYDALTGLPNKVMAFDHLRKTISRSDLEKKSFSLMLMKIDMLKVESHYFSDILRTLSVRLMPYIDRVDSFSRFDESHFIFILHHGESDEEIINTINHLMSESLKPVLLSGVEQQLSVCAGISKYPEDSKNWSELVTKAQLALERTVLQGESVFGYFQESRNLRAKELIELENKLTQAIERNEFYLVFQPIVDLEKHSMIQIELSFRWQLNKNRLIYPAQIIPMALEIDMLNKINHWMISNAMASMKRWNQEGLFINLILTLSHSFFLSEESIEFFGQMLNSQEVNPADLILAIQEDAIQVKNLKLKENLKKLSSMGIAIMITDFSKSNAALNKLNYYGFSQVGIDKSIIRMINKHKNSEILLDNLLKTINQMGMMSVASGIENDIQESFLLTSGCNFGKGYLYSDPLTENQMRQLMFEKQLKNS